MGQIRLVEKKRTDTDLKTDVRGHLYCRYESETAWEAGVILGERHMIRWFVPPGRCVGASNHATICCVFAMVVS